MSKIAREEAAFNISKVLQYHVKVKGLEVNSFTIDSTSQSQLQYLLCRGR